MASILDVLNTSLGKELIDKLSEETAEDKEKVSMVLGTAIPLLLSMIWINIKDKGPENLNAVIKEENGKKFLKTWKERSSLDIINQRGLTRQSLIGEKGGSVENLLSDIFNIEKDSAEKTLALTVPFLIAILTSQIVTDKIRPLDYQSLIASNLGNSAKFDSSLIETLLLKDGDSKVINSSKEMILGGGAKKMNDGGIMGGMLGSK